MALLPDEVFTPEEMRNWLEEEVSYVMKTAELRIKDATDFVTSYALGKLTAEQVHDRRSTYVKRWGNDSLWFGNLENLTSGEVLTRIDREQGIPQQDERDSWQRRAKKGKSGHRKE